MSARLPVMDSLGRLLLRFMLVPLAYLAAVLAGTLVILVGSWRLGLDDMQGGLVLGLVFAAPVLLVVLLSVMWLPGSIGILASELFAIRSWIFHAGNGALAAWIGWSLFGYLDDTRVALNEPPAVIAAGLAGGLVYWAIAGWSAGFWKPVFRRRQGVEPPPDRAAHSTRGARKIEEW